MGRLLSFEIALKQLIFNATPIAGLAENQVTGPLTDLYVSLATSQPAADADQTNNEVTYTGYARAAVPRTTAGWTVGSDGLIKPAAAIAFPAPTAATSEVATHVIIGTDASGVGTAIYTAKLTSSIVLEDGVVPQIEAEGTPLSLATVIL